MKDRPFFSVVMPVYNVEKYLRKAIDSVLNQNFKKFEIILVDDCSPDCCPEICDEYALKYSNIKVVHHKVNKGLSMSRNSGMDIANGRYIWFMDSDDYVENSLLEAVYESVQINPAQMILFGLVEDNYNKDGQLTYRKERKPQKEFLNESDKIHERVIDLEQQTLLGYAWNKFYEVDYLKSIQLRFEKITLIEDILFNVNYCRKIQSMNCLDITPYHYNRRLETSLTSVYVKDYFELHRKRIELLYNLYQEWKCCNEKVKTVLAGLYARFALSAIQRNCGRESKMSRKEQKLWIERLFEDKLFLELVSYMTPSSRSMKVFMCALKERKTGLSLFIGECVYRVKKMFPIVFAKFKEAR